MHALLLAILLPLYLHGASPQEAEEVVLRGTVTVKDRTGLLRTNGSGRVHVEVSHSDGEIEDGWHEFREGRWQMTVPPDALVSIGYAESGPDPVLVVEPEEWELQVPASRSIDVLVAAQQLVLLHVYDARTGEELDGITVLQCWGDSCNSLSKHPFPSGDPSEDTIAQDAESPIQLPPCDEPGLRSRITYWVRAPGYAWRILHCDPTRGGVLSVPLEQEARLRWTLEGTGVHDWSVFSMRDVRPRSKRGSHPVSHAWARLRSAQFERRRGGQEIELDGLLPGAYELLLRSAATVATARVELTAGRTTVVESSWRRVAERVSVRGTVAIPDSWPPARSVTLKASEADAAWPGTAPATWTERDLDSEPGRVLTWSSRSALQGTTELELGFGTFPMTAYIDIRVSPDATWHHELPDLAKLVVRCTDLESGEPLVQRGALGAQPGGPSSLRLSSPSIHRDRRSGERSFALPVGSTTLRFHAPGWLLVERTIEVAAGTTLVTLEGPRAHSLSLILQDGEMPLAAYSLGEVLNGLTLTRDGSPTEPAAWMLARGILLELDHAGPWTVKLDTLPGFEPVEPFDVFLRRGERVERIVRLERVRPQPR